MILGFNCNLLKLLTIYMNNSCAKCFFSKELRQIDMIHTQLSTPYPQILWKKIITPKND